MNAKKITRMIETVSAVFLLSLTLFTNISCELLTNILGKTEPSTIDDNDVYKYSYKFNTEFKISDKPSGTKPANVVLAWLQDSTEEAETNFSVKNFSVKLNGSQILSKNDFYKKLEYESYGINEDGSKNDEYHCFFLCLPENFSDLIKIDDVFNITIEAKADRKISNIPSFYLIDQTEAPYYWRDIGKLSNIDIILPEEDDEFVENYLSLPENLRSVSFQNKNYKIDKAYEFNDAEKFKEEWVWTPFTQDSRTTPDGKIDFNGLSRKENVCLKVGYPETLYVKDGSLHMIEQHYEKDGFAYCATNDIFSHIVHWSGQKAKRPYGFNQGLIEIKFKAPKDKGVSFAIFPSDLKQGWSYYGENGFYNDEGYNFKELDFCEYIPGAEGYVEPHGGVFICNKNHKFVCTGSAFWDEDGKYLYTPENWPKNIKIDENTWYDQWHTLKVVWEDFKFDFYYDDVFYKTYDWDEKYGNPKGDYGFQITPQYANNWFDEIDCELDWNDTKEHDFQIDYIRVYKEIK